MVDLCRKVYEGTEGKDYVKENIEPLGVWYALDAQGDIPDTLVCVPISAPMGSPISVFDLVEALDDPNTEIKWQNS